MAIVERSVPRAIPQPNIADKVGQLFQNIKTEIKEEIKEVREDLSLSKNISTPEVYSYSREDLQNLTYKDRLFIQQAKKIVFHPRNRNKQIIPCTIKHWKSK